MTNLVVTYNLWTLDYGQSFAYLYQLFVTSLALQLRQATEKNIH